MLRGTFRAPAPRVCALTICFGTTQAAASGSEARDVARDIARSGAAYYDEGAWEKARDHFHRAYQLIAAPTLALMEARALVNLGCLVQALAVYDLAITRLPDPANEAYRKAALLASTERTLLRARIPSVRLELPLATAVLVRIDGVRIDSSSLGGKLALDPGTHAIELQSPAGVKTWASVTLSERDEQVLQLPFASDERVSAPAPARQQVAMWSAFIVGTAGAALGVTAGAIASSQPAGSPEGRGWSSASTCGYLLGAAGAVTGLWLFASLPRAPTSPRVSGFVSAGGPALLVAGAF